MRPLFTSEDIALMEEADKQIEENFCLSTEDIKRSECIDKLAKFDALAPDKKARAIAQQKYRESHREILAKKQKAYYAKNREKIAAKMRVYREKNREELLIKKKAYDAERRTKRRIGNENSAGVSEDHEGDAG